VYYYHLDQLNTPRFVTNNKAKVVWENQADVYGYEELEADADFNKENSFTQLIRYQGQYLDEESGLHYNRYRYYSPKQQRFIHQDPIGLVGGINHYQYAPNPVNWVDPFGLSCKEKYIVLGEGQAAVEIYANLMRDKFPDFEFRTIGNDWKSIVRKSGASRESFGTKEWEQKAVNGNVQWIKDMHEEGYTFIDIGNDALPHRSSFYVAEKVTLKEIDAKVHKGSKRNMGLARDNAKPSERPPSKLF